jgi:lysophospholipase L1-like esterase
VSFRELVALGDSMTAGGDDDAEGLPCRNWVDWFVELMRREDPAFCAVNLAVKGKKLKDLLDEQLDPALQREPALVSVMIGGNDLRLTRRWEPEPFERDLQQLLHRLAERSHPLVLLATIPDFALVLPFSSYDIRRAMQHAIRAANAIISRVGQAAGAVVVELHREAASYDLDNYSKNLMHPNARGHELIGALMFEKCIEEHL